METSKDGVSKPHAMLTFSEFAQRYTDQRDLSADYAATLRKRAAALEQTAHRPYLPDVLQEAVVTAFLKALVCSPYTVAKYRQDFLCVWRAAADDDLVPYPIPRRIWRPKTPDLIVSCYTIEEVRLLAEGSEKLCGGLPNGVPRRRYWSAMIRLAWDTGLRRGDLWRVKAGDVRPDGSLVVSQRKTGKVVKCHVRPTTLSVLKTVGEMSWPLCLRAFAIHFAEITRLSNVNRGVFKWLRRASGSYAESISPGNGHQQLGNTRQVFEKHYDARLNGNGHVRPPEL